MKSEDADTALAGLLKYVHTKKMEHGKANVEGENEVRVKEQESEEAKVGVETRWVKNKKARKGRSRKWYLSIVFYCIALNLISKKYLLIIVGINN